MRKRPTIRVISFLAAGLLVAGVFAVRNTRRAHTLELYTRASTERAFDELVTNVTELSNALQKSVYTADPALSSALCTQIFSRAVTAQMAVGALPYESQQLEQTASFVAKVGDYAAALARSVGKNGGYSDEELQNLKDLADTASVMKLNLQDMRSRLTSGDLTMEQVCKSGGGETGAQAVPLAGSAFQSIEQEFPELPTLIYDGPFSESMTGRKPLYLEGRELVKKEDAVNAAARFLQMDGEDLECTGECGGDVPCWVCTGWVNGGEYTVSVTKQGGEILSVIGSRPVGQSSYSVQQGVEKAEQFLAGWGLESLQESYHTVKNGVVLVNFEHRENDVLCYPDLIKVGVALDNGMLVSYDAQGYISAHTDREIPEAAVSEEEARNGLSPELAIESHNMAIIPSPGGQERFCHEFVCHTETGEKYIVYVNAQTGEEEKILILLEDETGALTI